MTVFSPTELHQIAGALDACTGLFGRRLSPSDRASTDRVLEDPTWENWVTVRRIRVRLDRTLWRVAALTRAVGLSSRDVPAPGR
jgi:hypothetical protein